MLSQIQLFGTPWTQTLLCMGLSGQEYWNSLPSPPPGDLSNPGIEPESPAWQADSLPLSNCVHYLLSRVQLFVTPWTIARHSPRSMKFSRQEYWSGLPFPPPGMEGIPAKGSNPGLLHCRQILYPLISWPCSIHLMAKQPFYPVASISQS